MFGHPAYQVLFAAFAFLFGAAVGSFLNVCIYRLPLGMSVNQPKRSFCPHCKYQIPWYANLPLITWLLQRGKCANCGAGIAVRYFLVELLTGLLFLAVWWKVAYGSSAEFPGLWIKFFPLATFVSLLIVATFIDFEHFIIPDEITWGGTVAGIIFSAGIPLLQEQPFGEPKGHLYAAGLAFAGAALGFFLLWGVAWVGGKVFGKKVLKFNPPEAFMWKQDGDRAKFTSGKDEDWWDEFFRDEKDVLVMECESLEIEGISKKDYTLQTRYTSMEVDGKTIDLNNVKAFSGVVKSVTFRRDAMGFGDVKFIACIGAFLGWEAVLFTIVSASVIGALVGIIPRILRRAEWSAKIPFGPYLSLGALLWMFYGPETVNWYMNLLTPPDEPTVEQLVQPY